MQGIRALLVEADPGVRERLRRGLEAAGIDSHSADNPEAADEAARRRTFDILIADGSVDGTVGGAAFPLRVVLGTIEPPGAAEGLPHDASEGAIAALGRRLVERLETARREEAARERLARGLGLRGYVGVSRASERLRAQLAELGASDVPLWISGDVGVGKHHALRCLHEVSGREDGPFVALDAETLESYRWPTDDADPARLRRRVEHGTLAIDGFDRLSDEAQTRIVRAWRDGWFHDPESLVPRCRLAIVTRQDPDRLVAEGRVRDDAVRALGIARAHVPPLSHRPEDIPRLVDHFLDEIVSINRLPPIRVGPEALEALQAYRWPENVRELRGCVEHAAILAREGILEHRDLPERIRTARDVGAGGGLSAPDRVVGTFRDAKREVVSRFEVDYLTALMKMHRGNVTAAAQRAGMLRSALQRLLRKHGLKSQSFRDRRGGAKGARPAPREEV